MFPRVTAVLVVQHGGDRLRTTLDALRSQTRPPDDLAVVLMDADDATRRLVEVQRLLAIKAEEELVAGQTAEVTKLEAVE